MTRSMHSIPATRLLVFAAVLAVAATACSASAGAGKAPAADPAGAPGVAAPNPAASSGERDVAAIAKELQAATARHDGAAVDAAELLLANRLGRAQLDALESTYRLALADINVAMVSHDAQGIARNRAAFETLCAAGSLTSLLQGCDSDLATVMR
jgi:hypothetical protein